MFKRLPPVWLLVLLWWAAYAVLFTGQVMSMAEANGRPELWLKVLRDSFSIWMTWVPLTLGLLWVVRRWPLQPGQVGRALAAQSAAVAAVVLLRAAHMYFTNPYFTWYEHLPSFGEVAVTSLRNNVMMAWMIVAAAHALVLAERMAERERRLLQLEANLARSRLEALTAKLHPHFLFNTLNSIAELVQRDPDRAEDVLVGLSELLHDSLAADRAHYRPLREEADLIGNYLRIEQLRLGPRLQTHWSFAPDTLELPVPALVLLPLVENAIVHAIARRREPSRLDLRAWRSATGLTIEIENPEAPAGAVAGGGLGLAGTRERLHCLYGDRARLEPMHLDGRYRVRIELPAQARAESGLPAHWQAVG